MVEEIEFDRTHGRNGSKGFCLSFAMTRIAAYATRKIGSPESSGLPQHALSRVWPSVGIPVKVNADSAGKPNGVPLEGEQQSERSDAGVLIVR